MNNYIDHRHFTEGVPLAGIPPPLLNSGVKSGSLLPADKTDDLAPLV